MEVERAIVDLYRTFLMKKHVGERFEGTVTAVVGSGIFVQLDAPFVDVLVRLEDLGGDRWEVDDDALRVVAARSGDRVALGDRLIVEVTDAAILRRTVYARRIGGEARAGVNPRRPEGKRRDARRSKRDGRQREERPRNQRPGNQRPQPSGKSKKPLPGAKKQKKRRGR
jgi:ribonuclease R